MIAGNQGCAASVFMSEVFHCRMAAAMVCARRAVVGLAGLGDDFVAAVALGREFEDDGRAGHAVDAGQGGAAQGDVNSGLIKSGVEYAGEGQPARDGYGLSGLPGGEACAAGRREGRSEDVDAVTGVCGV